MSGLDMGIIGAGIIGGIGADTVGDVIQKALDAHPEQDFKHLVLLSLGAIVEDMAAIRRNTLAALDPKEFQHDYPTNIFPYPGNFLSLDTLGNHLCVYTEVPIGDAFVVIPQLGNYNLSIPAGWSTIDRPQGSRLYLVAAATAAVTVIVRTSEIAYGATI